MSTTIIVSCQLLQNQALLLLFIFSELSFFNAHALLSMCVMTVSLFSLFHKKKKTNNCLSLTPRADPFVIWHACFDLCNLYTQIGDSETNIIRIYVYIYMKHCPSGERLRIENRDSYIYMCTSYTCIINSCVCGDEASCSIVYLRTT